MKIVFVLYDSVCVICNVQCACEWECVEWMQCRSTELHAIFISKYRDMLEKHTKHTTKMHSLHLYTLSNVRNTQIRTRNPKQYYWNIFEWKIILEIIEINDLHSLKDSMPKYSLTKDKFESNQFFTTWGSRLRKHKPPAKKTLFLKTTTSLLFCR